MVNTTQQNACAVATKTADTYSRFAQLPANLKAEARKLYQDSSKKAPLVDCYFLVNLNGQVDWLFWSNPNL